VRVRVADMGSKNGLFFRDRREETFDIEAADVFSVGPFRLLAMTEEMRVVRPELEYLITYAEPRRVDELLVLGARNQPLLLLGEPKCGQARIAELLHSISSHRGQPFGAMGDIAGAAGQNQRLKELAGGTVLVDFSSAAIRRGGVTATMFSKGNGLRVIALADNAEQAVRVLGADAHRRFTHVMISPLRARGSEMARMIDYALVSAKFSLQAADLGDSNIEALAAQAWPENLDDLDAAIQRIGIVMTAASERKAAAQLGVGPSSLLRWLDRRGLVLPRRRRER
jgi:hypothetical protein